MKGSKNPVVYSAGVILVERLENQIAVLSSELSSLEKINRRASLLIEKEDPNGQEALAAATQELTKVKETIARKQNALVEAKEDSKRELEERTAHEFSQKWKRTADLCVKAIAEVEETEVLQAKASASYQRAILLAREAMQICPQTDKTPPQDSLLSEQRLVGMLMLELRKNGLRLAAPWFRGNEMIPNLAYHWKDAIGWLMKLSPPEIKQAGPWHKGEGK